MIGVIAFVVVIREEHFGLVELLFLVVGWTFIASGVTGWLRRPENRTGALMIAVGAMWFGATLLKSVDSSVVLTAGIWIGDIWLLPLVFLLAGFPAGRLQTRTERAALIALTIDAIPLEFLWLLFLNLDDRGAGPDDPPNALMIWDEPGVANVLDWAQRVILVISLATLAFVLIRRYLRARGPLRRALTPVLAGAIALVLLCVVHILDRFAIGSLFAFELVLIILTAVPVIFLVGLLRARLARSSIGDLLVELKEPAEPGALRDALAKALRDPSLQLAYWVPEYEAYVDTDGAPIELDGHAATTFVERGGTQVAALLHDPALSDEPELVGAVASAAGIALENERLQADLRARLSDLRASRARIVEAGDAARRKLERDLHDGAQQRLVSLSVVLRIIANRIPADSQEGRLLGTAREELTASLEELRNIARGIHPAILSDHGLPVALESLASRAPVRVKLELDLERRPPQQVEVAAYYLIAEGLTNVAKYADATTANVAVAVEHGTLVVEVADDGKGGADPANGSGLRGLADRVEALDGRLKLWSPPAGGTRLRAEIPCA